MKKFKTLAILFITMLVPFTSCKKEDDEVVIQPRQETLDMGANDETARNEYDGSIDAVFNALSNTGLQTGRSSSASGVVLPCGVIRIDSTGGTYKFVYDSSLNCGVRRLSGSITASLISGSKWSDVGATIQMVFTNYRVQFNANNQIIEFNGSINVVNRDGGFLYETLIGKIITHTVSGTFLITFNKNDTRSWAVSKKRIFESTNNAFSGLRFSLAADGQYAEVGTTKAGDPFTTEIPDPIVYENCSATGSVEGPFIAKRGRIVYTTNSNSLTAEPGYIYDIVSGTISQVNDCTSSGYKLTYSINGNSAIRFQYY